MSKAIKALADTLAAEQARRMAEQARQEVRARAQASRQEAEARIKAAAEARLAADAAAIERARARRIAAGLPADGPVTEEAKPARKRKPKPQAPSGGRAVLAEQITVRKPRRRKPDGRLGQYDTEAGLPSVSDRSHKTDDLFKPADPKPNAGVMRRRKVRLADQIRKPRKRRGLTIRERLDQGLPLNNKQRRMMAHIIAGPRQLIARNPLAMAQGRRTAAEVRQALAESGRGFNCQRLIWSDGTVLYVTAGLPIALIHSAPSVANGAINQFWPRSAQYFRSEINNRDNRKPAAEIAAALSVTLGQPSQEAVRLFPDREALAERQALAEALAAQTPEAAEAEARRILASWQARRGQAKAEAEAEALALAEAKPAARKRKAKPADPAAEALAEAKPKRKRKAKPDPAAEALAEALALTADKPSKRKRRALARQAQAQA